MSDNPSNEEILRAWLFEAHSVLKATTKDTDIEEWKKEAILKSCGLIGNAALEAGDTAFIKSLPFLFGGFCLILQEQGQEELKTGLQHALDIVTSLSNATDKLAEARLNVEV